MDPAILDCDALTLARALFIIIARSGARRMAARSSRPSSRAMTSSGTGSASSTASGENRAKTSFATWPTWNATRRPSASRYQPRESSGGTGNFLGMRILSATSNGDVEACGERVTLERAGAVTMRRPSGATARRT